MVSVSELIIIMFSATLICFCGNTMEVVFPIIITNISLALQTSLIYPLCYVVVVVTIPKLMLICYRVTETIMIAMLSNVVRRYESFLLLRLPSGRGGRG